MPAVLIDGKALASRITQTVQEEVREFQKQHQRAPGLAVVLAGEDPASQVYVRNKRNKCQEIGIRSFAFDLPSTVSEKELLELIARLNQDSQVDGILVQMPLPKHISQQAIIEAIRPDKDVDGLHPYNLGRLLAGTQGLVSCTPAGVMELIRSTGVPILSKKAVVIGRSLLVGKPVAMLLLQENATATLCHSRTKNLAAECQSADILVVAVGKKGCVPGEYVKPGAVVIDVGTNREDNKLCGDVVFEEAKERAGFITPVPGGVGPMTIAMLMKNTILAATLREGKTP